MNKLEVLIATMHRETKEEIINLLDTMNINSDSVVVSQCSINNIEVFEYKSYKVTCIYSTERGLSKSRNLALKNATAEIVVIADDDMRYVDGYNDIILDAYKYHPNVDIITFKAINTKKYFSFEKKLNIILIHKISSVEITIKKSSVINIFFNIFFGAGSSLFLMGEESIFLTDCIRKGKNIRFIPVKISELNENNRPSTWFTEFNKKYFVDKGAVYYQLSHFLAIPYIFIFAIRKYKKYKKSMGFFSAIYYMICGIKENKKLIK